MSATDPLDNAILFHEQECKYENCFAHAARAELVALRAIIKEQEQQIEYITVREATIKNNYEIAALAQAARVAELEQAVEELVGVIWNCRNRDRSSVAEKYLLEHAGEPFRPLLAAHPAPVPSSITHPLPARRPPAHP